MSCSWLHSLERPDIEKELNTLFFFEVVANMAPDLEVRNLRLREGNMPKDQEPGGGRAGI